MQFFTINSREILPRIKIAVSTDDYVLEERILPLRGSRIIESRYTIGSNRDR